MKHYSRWRKHGDPLAVHHYYRDPVANFWPKVDRRGDGECWPWLGQIGKSGHGRFRSPSGQLAHRYAYELLVGPIPDGMTLDHLCHSQDRSCPGGDTCPHRRCVNPAHLEPITREENIARGRSGAAVTARLQWAKTHCPRGHEYSPENTYVNRRGHRFCRACQAVYRARRKAAAAI